MHTSHRLKRNRQVIHLYIDKCSPLHQEVIIDYSCMKVSFQFDEMVCKFLDGTPHRLPSMQPFHFDIKTLWSTPSTMIYIFNLHFSLNFMFIWIWSCIMSKRLLFFFSGIELCLGVVNIAPYTMEYISTFCCTWNLYTVVASRSKPHLQGWVTLRKVCN